uniref:Putative competence-damage inducible protein n=1 Tax=Anthurium amnicola TaxID=1678845 RepID=A0A1D1ZI42_9ARAE
MNTVLLFVMWALVAAIPCQDRGLRTDPLLGAAAAPMTLLQERIVEESKKRYRRDSNSLLEEIHDIEKRSRHLAELTDPSQYPLAEDKELELRQWVQGLSLVCKSLKDGLDPLERQVRDVFHRIVRSRTDGLDCLGQAAT